jgi:peptide/nickel transport system substrate-binding protein
MKSLLWRSAIAGLAFLTVGSAEAAPPHGGTLIFGRNADSQFLDPVLNNANVDIWVLTTINNNLLLPTTTGKGVRPGLATGYTVSADGKTFTLKLRPGIKFSDGNPVTTDDVVWSLNRAKDPKIGIWNFLLSSIDTVSAKGDDTIVLTLKHADPSLPAALATFNAAIMPKKLFEAAKGTTDDEKAHSFAEHPIGAGPFMIDTWKLGTKMVLKRNPYYWGKDAAGGSLPYLDEIDMVIVPDDATRILQLKAGQIDATEFVPYERVAELKADPKLTTYLFPSTQITYVQLNAKPKLNDGTPNPLSDEKVRQALNYAINKQAIIKIVTHGLGTPMQSFIPSTTPLYVALGPAYPYNMAKARALLKEAGYEKGFGLSAFAQAGKADDSSTLTAIQQMWAPLGVKLSIQQVELAALDDRQHKFDYQMRTGYWTNDIADPNEITSYFAYYPTVQNQYSGWDSKETDKLFEESQEEQNPAKRAAQYKQIQEIYMKAAPMFFGYESPFAAASLKKVKGFLQIPLGNYSFENAYIEK